MAGRINDAFPPRPVARATTHRGPRVTTPQISNGNTINITIQVSLVIPTLTLILIGTETHFGLPGTSMYRGITASRQPISSLACRIRNVIVSNSIWIHLQRSTMSQDFRSANRSTPERDASGLQVARERVFSRVEGSL